VFLEELIRGLSLGSAYALLAVAVVLVFTGTRTLSVAMGEIGAFSFYAANDWRLDGLPLVGWRYGVPTMLLVACLVGAAMGLLIERFIMRPLVARAPLDKLIATLAIALSLALLELNLFSFDPIQAPVPFAQGTFYDVFGAELTSAQLLAPPVLLVTVGSLYAFLTKTKFGLATRATTSDPDVARLLGVKVNRVYLFAWVVGGLLAVIAALLTAPATSLIPFNQTTLLLRSLAGAIIGGLDSLTGAVVGCLIVGVVSTLFQATPLSFAGADGSILLLVLVTLLVRPRGLFGSPRAAF
jgi:branched-chain amino acid transport system permease protein